MIGAELRLEGGEIGRVDVLLAAADGRGGPPKGSFERELAKRHPRLALQEQVEPPVRKLDGLGDDPEPRDRVEGDQEADDHGREDHAAAAIIQRG